MFGGKLLEHACVGREAALGLLQGGQADYVEQDMGKLLGGIDVELLPRRSVDLGAKAIDLVAGRAGKGSESIDVDSGTRPLHAVEDADEGRVDLLVDRTYLMLIERGRQGVDKRSKRRRLERKTRGGGIDFGKKDAGVALGEGGDVDCPVVGVDHIRGERHVEEARVKYLSCGDARLLAGIRREHA